MADLKFFLKSNKKVKENVKYVATKSLTDADGNPLEWEVRAITTEENEKIQEKCMKEVPITGKPNQYRTKLDTTKYMNMFIASSVVYPPLDDAELQNSYGVLTPEDLIKKMIDNPVEYDAFGQFVQNLVSKVDINEKIEEAKN